MGELTCLRFILKSEMEPSGQNPTKVVAANQGAMSLNSRATCTAWVLLLASSLRRMLETWVLTVFSEIKRVWPISRLDRPLAISKRISYSRSLKARLSELFFIDALPGGRRRFLFLEQAAQDIAQQGKGSGGNAQVPFIVQRTVDQGKFTYLKQ